MLRIPSIACLLLLACSTEGLPDEPDPVFDAKLQIGLAASGSEGFVSVEDGSEATLQRGAQGGFHVWTAPRFQGAMGTVYLDRQARRAEDDVLVLRAARLVIDIPEDAMNSWWHQDEAIPSFMCPTPIGVQVFDTAIDFSFELRSEDEELLATDTITLVPRCPDDALEFCHSICGG